jgi:zinc protease
MPGVSLADAEAAMDKVVADFIKAGVNPEELDRIKTQIRASKIYGRDDAMGLAQEYGASLAVGLTIDDIQDWPTALQSITEADVLAAAAKVFDRRNAVTGWLTPKEEASE